MVNINDHNLLLAVGDTAQDVRITAIYADSLILTYSKEVKSIAKSKVSGNTQTNAEEKEKRKIKMYA